MVYRVFVEKKEGLDNEAKGLLNEARTLLGMERLENVRLFNRYDAENITEDLFRKAALRHQCARRYCRYCILSIRHLLPDVPGQ